MVRSHLTRIAPLALAAVAAVAALGKPQKAHADGDPTEAHERCATRLSVALLGQSASAALLASADPQAQVDAMIADPAFVERFARFANSQFNVDPGANVMEDASYTLAKYVLANVKPWKEMFIGQYSVTDTVTPDPNGLGYFRADAWMRRYAGNEPDGYRIVSAYRILQNTTGLKLTAVTNAEGVDISVTGRQNAPCNQCHFQNWYALDKVAKILSRRQGLGAKMTFAPPSEGPQTILSGQTISNDADLVNGLVASENFKFNACRLAFTYLYGREENTCEGTVFDKCRDAFEAAGTMQSAVAAIAKDPSYCQ
jgi:hypothetical protein